MPYIHYRRLSKSQPPKPRKFKPQSTTTIVYRCNQPQSKPKKFIHLLHCVAGHKHITIYHYFAAITNRINLSIVAYLCHRPLSYFSIQLFSNFKEQGNNFFLLLNWVDLLFTKRKSVKFNLEPQQHQNGHLSTFKLVNLFDPATSWDKDQLGDVLHWIRQALALVCGLLWGAIPLVGGIWFLLFMLLSSGVIYAYYALVLKIDEEDFGGHGALLQEGLFASISLFLLAWILGYSLGHF